MVTIINPAGISAGTPQEVKADVSKFDFAKSQVALVVAELDKYGTINASEKIPDAMAALKTAKDVATAIESKRVQLVKPFNDGATAINAYKKELVKDLDGGILKVKNAVLDFQAEELKRHKQVLVAARKEQLSILGFELNEKAGRYERENIGSVSVLEITNYEAGTWVQVIEGLTEQIRIATEVKKTALTEEKDFLEVFGSEEDKHEVNQKIAAAEIPVAAPRLNGFAGFSTAVKGTTNTWTFEITDSSLVPREYLEIKDSLITAAVREGKREIPGVRIFQKQGLSIR